MINPCFPLRRAILLLLCWVTICSLSTFLKALSVILSVMCLSRDKIICGIFVTLVSFDIFTSSLLLNLRGALCIYVLLTNKGKRDTTLSYYIMSIAILQILMFHVAYYCYWYPFIACITIDYLVAHASHYELSKYLII